MVWRCMLIGFFLHYMKRNFIDTKIYTEDNRIFINRNENVLNRKQNISGNYPSTDDRYGLENETLVLEELDKIFKHFKMNELLLLLENKEVNSYEKVKAIERYNRLYSKQFYASDLFKGLSIDDF